MAINFIVKILGGYMLKNKITILFLLSVFSSFNNEIIAMEQFKKGEESDRKRFPKSLNAHSH